MLKQRHIYNSNTSQKYQIKQQYLSFQKPTKIIKLTGNLKQNIDDLLLGIQCRCGSKRDYYQIVTAYAQKITKLRQQRNNYKQNVHHQKQINSSLKEQYQKLKIQYQNLERNYYIVRKQSVSKADYDRISRQQSNLIKQLQAAHKSKQQIQKICKNMEQQIFKVNMEMDDIKKQKDQKSDKKTSKNDSHDSYLLDDSKFLTFTQQVQILQKQNEYLRSKLNRYESIFKQFNFEDDEILNIFKQYVSEMPSFSTRQERELYRMASKMNNNLWKKKLQMQIKDLYQKKQSIKKLQQQFYERRLKCV